MKKDQGGSAPAPPNGLGPWLTAREAYEVTKHEALVQEIRAVVREEILDALSANTPRSPAREWLSVKDVADLLAVKAPTVLAWIQQNVLPASRLGPKSRIYRVARADLDAFLAAKGDSKTTAEETKEAVDRVLANQQRRRAV